MISQMSGTKVNIKGKTKTAWMGVYWTTNENGKRIEKDIDCGEWVMRMPDGEKIPQITSDEKVNWYKHLGSELTPG